MRLAAERVTGIYCRTAALHDCAFIAALESPESALSFIVHGVGTCPAL